MRFATIMLAIDMAEPAITENTAVQIASIALEQAKTRIIVTSSAEVIHTGNLSSPCASIAVPIADANAFIGTAIMSNAAATKPASMRPSSNSRSDKATAERTAAMTNPTTNIFLRNADTIAILDGAAVISGKARCDMTDSGNSAAVRNNVATPKWPIAIPVVARVT